MCSNPILLRSNCRLPAGLPYFWSSSVYFSKYSQMPLAVDDISNLPIKIMIYLTGRTPCRFSLAIPATLQMAWDQKLVCRVPVYDSHCIFSLPFHQGSSHQMATGTAPPMEPRLESLLILLLWAQAHTEMSFCNALCLSTWSLTLENHSPTTHVPVFYIFWPFIVMIGRSQCSSIYVLNCHSFSQYFTKKKMICQWATNLY